MFLFSCRNCRQLGRMVDVRWHLGWVLLYAVSFDSLYICANDSNGLVVQVTTTIRNDFTIIVRFGLQHKCDCDLLGAHRFRLNDERVWCVCGSIPATIDFSHVTRSHTQSELNENAHKSKTAANAIGSIDRVRDEVPTQKETNRIVDDVMSQCTRACTPFN